MWKKEREKYLYKNNFVSFQYQAPKIFIREFRKTDNTDFFLYASFLEFCYDFGFPTIENFPENSLNLPQDSLNTLKYFFPAALTFLTIAEKTKELSPLLISTFSGLPFQETHLLPYPDLQKNLEILTEHLFRLKKESFHRFTNFCYAFDLPEEYFSQFLTSEKDLAKLIIAKQMQRICFRKKFA